MAAQHPTGPVLIVGLVTGPIPIQQAGQLLYYTPQPHPHARVNWIALPSKPEPPPKTSPPYHKSFHLFPSLPIELRLRIWSFLAPSRVIELRSWGNTTTCPFTPIKFSIAPHTLPLILRINHESRTEGLRLYTPIQIGVSVSTIQPNRRYVSWHHHPNNPNSLVPTSHPYAADDIDAPLSWPHTPKIVHINWARDTIYLGPEFQLSHLNTFLTSPCLELPGLQNLALNKKLFAGSTTGSWNYLREALYALRGRPVKEVSIVVDDERNALADKYYYREHEVKLLEPEWRYEFRLEGETERSMTLVENLEAWFEKLWECAERVDEEGRNVGRRRDVPKVGMRSVRRDGERLGDFREGAWETQKMVGDMRVWKTWAPEAD
ncbi:hypothetical protein BKA65DRAFT_40337 [Rhexocercosporidium sp. MPI-PUGE-AT-0058]|nr:hypothetical protein BKA65DRAFT_40337 [Rhexocercosporidium sp. MPI-PUGE-AT-0058]